ncbi:MAG: endonuclease/exonuclease/phosphatase family protein [Anaerolineales bacterium]
MFSIRANRRNVPQWILAGFLLLAIGACGPGADGVSSSTSTAASPPLIAEVMAGREGDNNFEFIELYNPSSEPADLAGHLLVYRLATSERDLPVYQWTRQTLIPGHGYYLLVRRGEQVGSAGDAFFDQALNENGGGLALLAPDGSVLASLGWGNAPETMVHGEPAPAMEPGSSLAREVSGAGDFGAGQVDDADRYEINRQPAPQNSGAEPRGPAPSLKLSVETPDQVAPGSLFSLAASVENLSEQELTGVSVFFTMPEGFELEGDEPSVRALDGQVEWQVGLLAAGELEEKQLEIQAPWDYLLSNLENLRVENESTAAFAGPRWIQVAEGTIPIRVARGLPGQEVIVQGKASMYTGGLFAGSGNTKFYLQDETGGVQIWVPEGEGELAVRLGQEVRVRGLIEPYRGTIELIAEPPESVEVLAAEVSELDPEETSPAAVILEPGRFVGELIRVEGTLTRVEEFKYSFELDLQSDSGEVLTAYVDKMTEIQVETLEVDQPYAVTGILETPDSVPTLYPRVQGDIDRLRPQALVLETEAPANVSVGQRSQVVLLLSNYLERPVSEVEVVLASVVNGTVVEAIPEPAWDGQSLRWSNIGLDPGETAEFKISLAPRVGAERVRIDGVTASEASGEAAAELDPFEIIVGDTVPVSAVQGSGMRSPFVLNTLTVEGVVTGVFPELEGFWIQSIEMDDDPTTSEGLFINLGEARANLEPVDLIRASGRVREISQQTQLQIESLAEVEEVTSGLPQPDPVPLDPPMDSEEAEQYFEALEGMTVRLAEPARAIGPTNRYGETPVVLARHEQGRLTHADEVGHRIIVDDGSSIVHNDRSTLTHPVATGDMLTAATGPLAYTYGQYKIEPVVPPVVQPVERPLPPPASVEPGAVSFATWNVENLFDILEPHPSNPPRPRLADYERDLQGVADTIEYLGKPTIVALQEVENLKILEDLVALPELSSAGYTAHLIEGTDGRGIDVGYLIRSDIVEVIQLRQVEVEEDLLSRPPLLVVIEIDEAGPLNRVALINNHFTSMAAGVEATEPRRIAQAQLNAAAAQELLTRGSVDSVVILGDLNSFFRSPPIDRLRGIGLQHVLDEVPERERYNYIYQGISQTLDHILVSPELAGCLVDVDILHLNADFPPPDLEGPPMLRSSDHDPVMASFLCSGN